MMDTNTIIGLDSAYLCAQETGSGNMQISGGLVVELIDRLRAAETECQELRHAQNSLFDRLSDLTAYKEAAEKQEPLGYASDTTIRQMNVDGYRCANICNRQSNNFCLPVFLNPVPDEKPSPGDLEIVQKALSKISGQMVVLDDGSCEVLEFDRDGVGTYVYRGHLSGLLTWAKQTIEGVG